MFSIKTKASGASDRDVEIRVPSNSLGQLGSRDKSLPRGDNAHTNNCVPEGGEWRDTVSQKCSPTGSTDYRGCLCKYADQIRI